MSELARITRFEAKTTGDGSQIILTTWGTNVRVQAATPREAVALAKKAYADHLAETTGRRWVIYEATFSSAENEDRDIGPTLVGIPTLTTVTEARASESKPENRLSANDTAECSTKSTDSARAALTGESPLDEVLASIARVVRPEE